MQHGLSRHDMEHYQQAGGVLLRILSAMPALDEVAASLLLFWWVAAGWSERKRLQTVGKKMGRKGMRRTAMYAQASR